MSSIHLPSFFTTKKPMETKSMRVKRSTTSFTQDIINTSMPEQYEIKRSNTLSKVKRFGSMLVRGNNNSSRPNMPNFSSTSTSRPPTIDTKGLSNASFSSSSDSEEDEENLMTPIDAMSPPEVISNKQQFLPLVFPKVVSTVTKNDDFYLDNNDESFEYTPMDHPLKLNLALLVQHELSDAFEEADLEFEANLEMSRRAMLQSIQSR